jgi:hypothetical protein
LAALLSKNRPIEDFCELLIAKGKVKAKSLSAKGILELKKIQLTEIVQKRLLEIFNLDYLKFRLNKLIYIFVYEVKHIYKNIIFIF